MHPSASNLIRRIGLALVVATAWPAAFAAPGPATKFALETDLSGTLDPRLAQVLPDLLAVMLESSGDYVIDRGDVRATGPELSIRVVVTGRSRSGPWKLQARLENRSGDGGRDRRNTDKVLFSDRESLTEAIERTVAAIRADQDADTVATAPSVATDLSVSTAAVDAYLDGMRALRAHDFARASEKLQEANRLDPAFDLAAAENTLLALTAGDMESVDRLLAREPSKGTVLTLGRSAFILIREAWSGQRVKRLAGTARERGGRFAHWADIGEGLRALSVTGGPDDGELQSPSATLGRALAADPRDPRLIHWLGLAQMSEGDFAGAIESFRSLRDVWPELLYAYAMQAECHARRREVPQARQVLEAMKTFMRENGIAPPSDARDPDLMLGAADLLEGRFGDALVTFETALNDLSKGNHPMEVTGTLHRAIFNMQRERVASRDPLTRSLELDAAQDALARYEESLSREELHREQPRLLRLHGMLHVREGNTVEAWKLTEQIRELGDEYEALRLAAVITLKEGDLRGAVERYEGLIAMGDELVDLIQLGQVLKGLKMYDRSWQSFELAGKRIERYLGAWPPDQGKPRDMFLIEPQLAALVPAYHYQRARLGFLMGNAEESRHYFNRLLGYYRDPDEELRGMVVEARARGATPE